MNCRPSTLEKHVRQHREELQSHGRFMFNLDSFGSLMGWNQLVCNGPETMGDWIHTHFKRHHQYLEIMTETDPYADHFPFVAAGVPAVYLGRENCSSGHVAEAFQWLDLKLLK